MSRRTRKDLRSETDRREHIYERWCENKYFHAEVDTK